MMQVDWNALSAPLQTLIVRTLLIHLPAMSCRETIVAVWSLGKLGLSFRDLNRLAAAGSADQADPTDKAEQEDSSNLLAEAPHSASAEESPASASVAVSVSADSPRLQLLARLRSEMLGKLEAVTPQMTLFDSESLLLALGLMEVRVNNQFIVLSVSFICTQTEILCCVHLLYAMVDSIRTAPFLLLQWIAEAAAGSVAPHEHLQPSQCAVGPSEDQGGGAHFNCSGQWN